MKTALVALGGSPASRSVLEQAEGLAHVFGAKLILLRVIETDARSGLLANAVQNRLARAEASTYLRGVANGLVARGIDVARDVGFGDPATEILRLAEAERVDLIVLGPNEGSSPADALGGTALKVAARGKTSLLLARPSSRGPSNGAPVLSGVDGSPNGDWAAFHSARLARARGSDLVLAHISVEPELMGAPAAGAACELAGQLARANRIAAMEHLERLRRQLQQPGLRIRTVVLCASSVLTGLSQVAHEYGADLTVVGATGWSPRKPGHGSVANALLTTGGGSILVCQPTLTPADRGVQRETVLSRPNRLQYARAQ
ncbi:MAG: universal stress protein [Gemmatimonadota bacterium]|nr:universal stress protein [Gemmatimonadota bacterium]